MIKVAELQDCVASCNFLVISLLLSWSVVDGHNMEMDMLMSLTISPCEIRVSPRAQVFMLSTVTSSMEGKTRQASKARTVSYFFFY